MSDHFYRRQQGTEKHARAPRCKAPSSGDNGCEPSVGRAAGAHSSLAMMSIRVLDAIPFENSSLAFFWKSSRSAFAFL